MRTGVERCAAVKGALVGSGVAVIVVVHVCAGISYVTVAGASKSAKYCGAAEMNVFSGE